MPIRRFKCPLCGYERETFKKEPKCNHNQEEEGTPVPLVLMEVMLTVPQTRFLEATVKERGKSQLVGQQKDLKERARAHSRDVEMDEFIQKNDTETAHAAGWVKPDGSKRKAIDDK